MMSKNFLVGHTGFVGSNIVKGTQFDMLSNSKNVKEMYDGCPELLIYAGVTGTKWYANAHEEQDKEIIESAIYNIKRINPQKLVLISTVDVYDNLNGTNEDYENDFSKLHVYGQHRLELEHWVMGEIKDYHIIRLPAIYGENLRKNFIFDLINYIPQIMTQNVFETVRTEFSDRYGAKLENYYRYDEDGFYNIKVDLNDTIKRELYHKFKEMDHNALMFTNAESEYQFYNLKYLWNHIKLTIDEKIKIINLVTEPLSANEICMAVDKRRMHGGNVQSIQYRLQSKHASCFGGDKGYLYDKNLVLENLKKYIYECRKGFEGE